MILRPPDCPTKKEQMPVQNLVVQIRSSFGLQLLLGENLLSRNGLFLIEITKLYLRNCQKSTFPTTVFREWENK